MYYQNQIENRPVEQLLPGNNQYFTELYYKIKNNKCVMDSISNILPQCSAQGIESLDPYERKVSAVKLSICEFQEARMMYPEYCNDLTNGVELCIAELQHTPQYWTTFSGYYREIATICYQESFPYQKEQIIDLYQNITLVYSKFLQDIKKSNGNSKEREAILKNKFDEVLATMNSIIGDQKRDRQEMQSELQNYNTHLKFVLHDSISLLKDYSEEVDTFLGNIDGHFTSIISQLDELSTEIVNKKSNIDVVIDEVSEKVLASSQNSVKIVEYMENKLEKLISSTGMNQELTNELSIILQKDKGIVSDMNSAISVNNQLIIHQHELIEERLESAIKGLTQTYEKQLDSFLNHSKLKVEESINESVIVMETYLENTKVKMEHMSANVGLLINEVNNFTAYIFDMFSSINRINPLLKIGLPFSRIWNRITTATYRVVISSSFFIIFLLTIRYFPKSKKISLSFKSKNLFRKMWFVLRGVLMGTSIVLGVVSALIIVRLLQYVQRYRTEMEI
ncbi:hypothetical protein G9P44_005684 [Scheffersomyces stipitis]|nr:hypothetical protein G9P44_005684 [Scheffersomyces stipitis]